MGPDTQVGLRWWRSGALLDILAATVGWLVGPETQVGLRWWWCGALLDILAAGWCPVHHGRVAPLQLWRPGQQGGAVIHRHLVYPGQGLTVLL